MTAHQVCIVGAGLAGLTAAHVLARAGRAVVVLDALETPGGRCAVRTFDGVTYAVGANTFGGGARRLLRRSGLRLRWRSAAYAVHHRSAGGRVTSLPLGWGRILRWAPALMRMAMPGCGAGLDASRFVRGVTEDPVLRDLLFLPSYFAGFAPARVPAAHLLADRRYGYGYTQPLEPVGGPGALVAALLESVREHGGEVLLGRRVERLSREAGSWTIETQAGPLRSESIVLACGPGALAGLGGSSEPPPSEGGLAFGVLLLAVEGDPTGGTHTHVFLPADLEGALEALEEGSALGADSPFHLIRSDLPVGPGGSRGLSLLFPWPRGRGDSFEAPLCEPLLERATRALPGLSEAIKGTTLLDPEAYAKRVGLPCVPLSSSEPARVPVRDGIVVAGAETLDGGHAGAAILSGARVAGSLIRAKQPRVTHV